MHKKNIIAVVLQSVVLGVFILLAAGSATTTPLATSHYSRFQTTENLVADLRFLEDLSPDMVGIGPYITHKETPFSDKPSGTLGLTLRMLAILRIMFPHALLPATTALGSIHPEGREMGLRAGANVVMPNLSPMENRKKYAIYENKIATGLEAAQNVKELKEKFAKIGYKIVTHRGDVKR